MLPGFSSRLRLALTVPVLALVGCPVDERNLMLAEGSGGNGSNGGGGSDNGGSSGADAAGGNAGDPSASGAAGDGSSGSAGAAGSAGTATGGGGGATGGGGTTGGAGGTGGTVGIGGCGDLDGNGVRDCDETIAQNPHFDVDTAGWEIDSEFEQAWDPRNAGGGTDSGALLVVNTTVADVEGKTGGGVRQCFPAWGHVTYSLASRVFIPDGQGEGEGGIIVAFYGAENCSDYFLTGNGSPALVSETGVWTVAKGEATAPPAARSMFIRLVARKPFVEEALEVLFDDVLVREVPEE